MGLHWVELDDEELNVIILTLDYMRNMLIDDAQDDPTVDHSDRVPKLGDLIDKLKGHQ